MTPLLRLSTWARALTGPALPPSVARLARLQHLAAAASVRATRATSVAASDAPGPARDGADLARFAWDDGQLGGRVGLGVLPQAWARAEGHSLDAWLAATVAAGELGGRVGLAALLAPRTTELPLFPAVAGGAAAAALLEGRSATGVAEAVSGAVSTARRVGLSWPLARLDPDPAELGRAVARLVDRGLEDAGSHSLLDADHPFWKEACARPLPAALGGEGQAWLTHTLVFAPEPGLPNTHVAVQAIGEILRRHVKAAEKRLRPDQVERIEIRVPFFVWAAERATAELEGPGALLASIARLAAVRVAWHALTPAELDPATLGGRADELAALASRVEVRHDWGTSFAAVEALTAALPVFGGLGPADYRAVRGMLKPRGAWPRWTTDEVPTLLRTRPDRILAHLGGPARAPDTLDAFAWEQPVRVKLYTTRGGWWPERRGRPEGIGEDAERIVRARFGDDARVDALLALPGDAPARDFLAGLSA